MRENSGSRAGEQIAAIEVRYGRGIALKLDLLNLDGPIAAALLEVLGFDSHQVCEILKMPESIVGQAFFKGVAFDSTR